jgi:hypothetical protein
MGHYSRLTSAERMLAKNNKQLREMILEALEQKGGAEYLAR